MKKKVIDSDAIRGQAAVVSDLKGPAFYPSPMSVGKCDVRTRLRYSVQLL